jgi:hypothetical protein
MGVEPTTNPPNPTGKPKEDDQGGAKAALGILAEEVEDSELADVIRAWAALPGDVRKMIAGVARLTPRVSGEEPV